MTTLTQPAPAASGSAGSGAPTPSGVTTLRLLRAELLKIWTTNSWWIFGIITLATTGLAILINTLQANSEIGDAVRMREQGMPDFSAQGPKVIGPDGSIQPDPNGGIPPQEIERMRADWLYQSDVGRVLIRSAANIYTSGQFFALLFLVVLGALVVTNEFFHQTATATFLTTPKRTHVIVSKLAAGIVIAFAFWLIITLIDLAAGALFFSDQGYDLSLNQWSVQRSIIMNLLAYVIWAVLGIGLGVLLRSQLGATLTGAAFYLLSYPVAFIFFGLIREFIIKKDWVWNWIVAVPGVASQVMISPERLRLGSGNVGPDWWMGAVVLVGYGILAAVVGTLITRKRDIS
jgi:ABC-2 type transport system permease protein